MARVCLGVSAEKRRVSEWI